eukprot:Opistho-2@34242
MPSLGRVLRRVFGRREKPVSIPEAAPALPEINGIFDSANGANGANGDAVHPVQEDALPPLVDDDVWARVSHVVPQPSSDFAISDNVLGALDDVDHTPILPLTHAADEDGSAANDDGDVQEEEPVSRANFLSERLFDSRPFGNASALSDDEDDNLDDIMPAPRRLDEQDPMAAILRNSGLLRPFGGDAPSVAARHEGINFTRTDSSVGADGYRTSTFTAMINVGDAAIPIIGIIRARATVLGARSGDGESSGDAEGGDATPTATNPNDDSEPSEEERAHMRTLEDIAVLGSLLEFIEWLRRRELARRTVEAQLIRKQCLAGG